MSQRPFAFFFFGLAAAGLAGCNAARTPQVASQAAPAAAARGVTPPDFQAPDGSGCSGAVARYRAVMENDLAMGHVNQSVYAQIQSEISDASAACSAGQDGRALSLLRASKSRHGYPG